MNEFGLYLQMGLEHITDLNGWDHMAFLVALSAGYVLKDWRKVAILATAFTLGHSLTLAMTALGMRLIPAETVEMLIPITIVLSAVFNFLVVPSDRGRLMQYSLALVFGLVHGMGFAGYFGALLGGMEESILLPLLAFNIGIELGQLGILLVVLTIGWVLTSRFKLSGTWWRKGVSVLGGIAGAFLLWRIFMGG